MSARIGTIAGIGADGFARADAGSAAGIAIIGATGRVGRRLLELLASRRAVLAASGVHLRLVAVANSRTYLIAREGLPPEHAAARLNKTQSTGDEVFADSLLHLPRPLIVVDCTASVDIAARYPQWLGAGIDVVTPNKFGPSADRPLARAIAAAQTATGAVLRDATTVGAQLPLLQTLRDLRAAGDKVERFEAVLSGTLSYVLGNVQAGAALSTAVRDAVAQGYAEPHPACDLSGEDAARKLVILLRALGHDVELRDVERVALIDAALLDESDPVRLLAGLAAADETWRARAAIADSRHERWIYRASFDPAGFDHAGPAPGRARVAPERVALDHPLARLAPCENALILHSHFYRAAPLTVAGPGAGIDLTAAGVFADVLAVAQRYRTPASTHGAVAFDAVAEVEAAA
jgi:bifunctional aspartokinase / homoserine dehydrogenase 1